MLCNITRNFCIARNPRKAENFFIRLLGLMGRKNFPENCDALIFDKCNAIHCFFMRMEIDVIFISKEGEVTACFHSLKPWHLAFGGRKSFGVIELPAGVLSRSRTVIGDKITFTGLSEDICP